MNSNGIVQFDKIEIKNISIGKSLKKGNLNSKPKTCL